MPPLPAHIHLTDSRATPGDLRDQLSPEPREAVAKLLAALPAADAPEPDSRRPRFTATLVATDDRAVVTVTWRDAEASIASLPSGHAAPLLAALRDGVRLANPVEAILAGVHALFRPGAPDRDWRLEDVLGEAGGREGVALVARDAEALRRFLRRTYADVAVVHSSDERLLAVVWPDDLGNYLPAPNHAPLVLAVGLDPAQLRQLRDAGVDAPNARLLALPTQAELVCALADETVLMDAPPNGVAQAPDVRFLDRLVSGAYLVVVVSGGSSVSRAVTAAALRHLSSSERCVVHFDLGALGTDAALDAEVRVQLPGDALTARHEPFQLVRALSALASEGGTYAFEVADLLAIAKPPACVTGFGFGRATGERAARRATDQALDALGWSTDRIRDATAFVVAVWGGTSLSLRETERVMEAVYALTSDEAGAIPQRFLGPAEAGVRVAILMFEHVVAGNDVARPPSTR